MKTRQTLVLVVTTALASACAGTSARDQPTESNASAEPQSSRPQSQSSGGAVATYEAHPRRCPPVKVALEVTAEAGINAAGSSAPRPVVLRIYHVHERSRLMAASFDDLLLDDKKALGDTLDWSQELTVFPSDKKVVEPPDTAEDGELCVVGLFKSPDRESFRSCAPLPSACGDKARFVALVSGSTLELAGN